MKTYAMVNIITGEVRGTVSTYTLAAAQEYFDILFPYASSSCILLEIK